MQGVQGQKGISSVICDPSEVDVAFVIDGSGSLGIDNYKLILQFVANIIGNLTVDVDHGHVAALVFSSGTKVLFNFQSLGYSEAGL